MDKKSTPEQPLIDELLSAEKKGLIPDRYVKILSDFLLCYRSAVEESGGSFTSLLPLFRLFFQLAFDQFRSPHSFEPYHKKVRHPVDYFQFGIDFLLPLVDLPNSKVIGEEHIARIEAQLAKGENAIFLANHQMEPDPQAIAILLRGKHPKLAEQIIYVAGERVVTDPLAIPFSMGTDLICIYSKRYIDHVPELKTQKLLHNKQTMERMSRLLQEGGKAIYVAPAGGRDRRDSSGKILPAPFDPQSIELFYLMAKRAKTPTHFYPLALSTYDLIPPPETIQKELGETRKAQRVPIRLAFGPECDMEHFPGSELPDKDQRRSARASLIWTTVKNLYEQLL